MTATGKSIGAYSILEMIGEGGMGKVYRGQHQDTGEIVAIKMLTSQIAQTPDMLERFRREGEALRRLNHPNIVKILDVVEEEGENALILEYVAGGSLDKLLEEQAVLPLSVALRIALELADALTRAHHLKIIHRDIKPANVLLAADGTPRLTDFGLVQAVGSQQNLTQDGAVVGTYAYLAPEAIEGGDPDPRMDIWAYGILLYEMLTGKRPFEGEQAASLLYNILSSDPPDIRLLREDVPRGVAELIEDILVKDPALRISSMRHVGARLEDTIRSLDSGVRATIDFGRLTPGGGSRFTTPTPSASIAASSVRARHASPLPSTKSKLPWLIGAAVLMLLVLAIGLVYTANSPETDSGDNTEIIRVEPVADGEVMVLVARLEPIDAPRDNVDRFILEDLREIFELAQGSAGIRIREYTGVITTRDAARAAAEANQAAIVVWGNYSDELIEIEILPHALGDVSLSPELLENTGSVRVQLSDPRQQSLAPQIISNLALWSLYEELSFESARMMLILDELNIESGEILGVTTGTHVHNFFESYFTDTQQSIETMDEALRLDPQNPLLYHLRGIAQQRLGLTDAAGEDFNTSLRLTNREWATSYIVLANLTIAENDIEGTLDNLDKAIEFQPDDWFLYTIRGGIRYMNKDYIQAEADYQAAIARQPKANFPYTFSIINALREGRIDDVLRLQTIIQEQFPDPSFVNRIMLATIGDEGEITSFWGTVLSAFGNLTLGQYDDARRDAAAAIDMGNDLPELYLMLGITECASGNFAEAEAAYTKGIELDPDFTILYLLRADIRAKQNNFADSVLDFGAAQDTPNWENFVPYIEGGNLEMDCQSFFS
jgi:serine/threonine protein kinase/tetratricopeptide (TPR) repeat protein